MNDPPTAQTAACASADVNVGDSSHEGLHVIDRLSIGCRHFKCGACLCEAARLDGWAQQSIVTDAFEAQGKNVLKKPGYELLTLDLDDALLADVISTDSKQDMVVLAPVFR